MSRDSREEILRRIRKGLYGSTEPKNRPTKTKENLTNQEPKEITDEFLTNKKALTVQFLEEVRKISGNADFVDSENGIKDFILRFVEERGFQFFTVWDSDLLRSLNIRNTLESRGLQYASPDDKHEMAKADIGITEADFGIANSGTIVLLANERQPRTVSLIPSIHIAILKSDKIVGNINDLFAHITNLFVGVESVDNITSCMTFITGPSRTADIELNLTLGVHGPKEIYVLVLD